MMIIIKAIKLYIRVHVSCLRFEIVGIMFTSSKSIRQVGTWFEWNVKPYVQIINSSFKWRPLKVLPKMQNVN